MDTPLNLYRIFYTVARHGNISRASEELYISQPAISKSVAKLEESLSAALFVRNSRGVTLTYEGEILYEHLKTAFEAIDTGEEMIRKINVLGIGHLKIGASTTFCKYLLLPFLKGFVEEYPHIKITIECQSSYHSLKLLENRQIDLALIVPAERQKSIEFLSLGEFQDIFTATDTYLQNLHLRENSEPNSSQKAREELFRNANLMLLGEDNLTRTYVDNYLKLHNFEVNQVLEVDTMDLLIEFARIGLGVACVVKEFISDDLKDGRLVEIPMTNPMKPRSAGFACLKGAASEPAKAFMEYVRRQLTA